MGLLLVSLEYSRRFYEYAGYNGTLDVSARMTEARYQPWLHRGFTGTKVDPSSLLDDRGESELSTDVRELKARRNDLVKDLARGLLYSLNWAEAASNPKTMDAFLKAGYASNGW